MRRVVNVLGCELDESLERGAFGFRVRTLGDELGATWLGAAAYEMTEAETSWPYHFHHGVEEWLYVAAGAPVLRTPAGERALAPGELAVFPDGPAGAHTVRGPGRVVIFSVGTRGFGEAFAAVYPDSDKLGAAPGVMFRRADGTPEPRPPEPSFGGAMWAATAHVLGPGEAASAYLYEWCRESCALVLEGAVTLRDPEGERTLRVGDLAGFPQGPDGARRLSHTGDGPARLVVFSTPVARPRSVVYPDTGEVVIRTSDSEALRFRLANRIEDYWDGEPDAISA